MAKRRIQKTRQEMKPLLSPVPSPSPAVPAVPAVPAAPTLASLSGLSNALLPEKVRQVEIDVTRFFPASVVLTWERPDVRKVYAIENDMAELMRRFPLWSAQMAIDVATISACHLAPSPGGVSAGLFYAHILETNSECWFFLLQQLMEHFPHLKGARDPEQIEQVFEMCVEYLNANPDQLEGDRWDAELLNKLMDMKRRKEAQTNI